MKYPPTPVEIWLQKVSVVRKKAYETLIPEKKLEADLALHQDFTFKYRQILLNNPELTEEEKYLLASYF